MGTGQKIKVVINLQIYDNFNFLPRPQLHIKIAKKYSNNKFKVLGTKILALKINKKYAQK